MDNESIRFIVLSAAFLFALVAGFIVYFVILYQKKQLKNKKDQEEREAFYRQEVLKTQIEIQEQTFEHVSKEIHDNITQVLSFVKLSMGTLGNTLDDAKKAKMNESRELIAQAITDLRDLSKSMSFEHITSLGLTKTIEREVEKLNKSELVKTTFLTEGQPYPLGEQRELVLFRILQEALNNALKHAKAKHFKIDLQYQHDLFTLSIEDDGAGFSPELLNNKSGSGLRNMGNRAALIGGNATIDSAPGEGCRIKVSLNPFKQLYIDGGPHPNSVS
ncbi:sensor histidine kinase [Mucilaginibacter ginsenosidivorans]|uniref:histidine kinase n=1 Tax=Mucilaginibacter ginsenosidivorans TaxID=398053 RepID=A0A5B8URZ3_9SPHI|nr:sensor histidine kinase [Mucilaginibacter ginsenosidivorans]QEC61628.1 sensor histidine kinase [Mucilaginibacter ginsenosidivorans]